MVLGIVVVAGYFAFLYVRETPRYSLYQFSSAILNHNPQKALLYLDVDSVIDNIVKETFPAGTKDGLPKDKSGTKRSDIAEDIVRQNLPTIKKQMKEQIGSTILTLNDQTILSKLGRTSVLGLAISVERNVAYVKMRNSEKLAFRMEKSPHGRWKIVAVNVQEFWPGKGNK